METRVKDFQVLPVDKVQRNIPGILILAEGEWGKYGVLFLSHTWTRGCDLVSAHLPNLDSYEPHAPHSKLHSGQNSLSPQLSETYLYCAYLYLPLLFLDRLILKKSFYLSSPCLLSLFIHTHLSLIHI